MSRSLIVLVAFVLALTGCSDDDEPTPRDPHSGGGSQGSTTGPNGDEADIGFDARTDVGADVEDDDDVIGVCELEPQVMAGDPRFPCCFTVEDCRESGVPQAESMVCYQARCEEGGEGTCRVPPTQQMRCWDDLDCPDGYTCPHDETSMPYRCQDPTIQEEPPFCVEDGD